MQATLTRAITVLVLAAGCGAGMRLSAPAPSTAGVTTGGAQDIGLARNQVAAGTIPSPNAFVIEGLLSEHDIDVTGPPCKKAFCLNTATGRARALDTGDDAAFLVLGFSSSIDLSRFHRRALNLSVVVDRSGSMGGARIAAARAALHELVDQLGPRDRLSILVFDHTTDVLVRSRRVDNKRWLHEVVDSIHTRGSTDIESALARGFREVGRHTNEVRDDRVILITDARPNTGRTASSSFVELMQEWADRGVGLTVMGVGIDFGQQLTLAMSRVPNSNYFYLEDHRKLEKVFDEDFDLLVTPVAHDFELVVEPAPGYRIAAAYGVPSWADDEAGGAIRLHVPTLFLSRNRGAIVLRLEPLEGNAFGVEPLGTAELSYRTALATGGDPHTTGGEETAMAAQFEAPAGPSPAWEQPGVQTAVTLVNTALGAQRAAGLAHAGRPGDALDVLDRVDDLLDPTAFPKEHRLIADLRRLVSAGVPREAGPRAEVRPIERPRWIR